MANLNKNQKATLNSVFDSIELDIQAAKRGVLTMEELETTTAARLQHLKKAFELNPKPLEFKVRIRQDGEVFATYVTAKDASEAVENAVALRGLAGAAYSIASVSIVKG